MPTGPTFKDGGGGSSGDEVSISEEEFEQDTEESQPTTDADVDVDTFGGGKIATGGGRQQRVADAPEAAPEQTVEARVGDVEATAGDTDDAGGRGEKFRPPSTRFAGTAAADTPRPDRGARGGAGAGGVGGLALPRVTAPDVDQDIVEQLTEGRGLFVEGTRQLDEPGALEAPENVPSDVANQEEFIAAEVAERNPGVDVEDVSVTRTDGELQIQTDLDTQDVRERVAAANPGVEPADVRVRRGEDGDIEFVTRTGEGGGFLQTTEAELRDRARQRQDFFGIGAEAETFVEGLFDETGGEVATFEDGEVVVNTPEVTKRFAGDVAFGIGSAPGQLAAAPTQATLAADVATEATVNLPETVEEEGAGPVAETIAGVGVQQGEQTIETAQENPGRFAGQLGAEVATGTVLARGLTRLPDIQREARIRARQGDVVQFTDVSDPPRTTMGELPAFTERAVSDPEAARAEFVRRAEDQPLAEGPVAFSGRSPAQVSEFGRFGREFEAPAENPDVSGQFFAADLSPLRLPGSRGRSGVRVGVPRIQLRSASILAEEDVDVRAAPTRGEADLDRFLREEASQQASFVRGQPTPEQEVVAPPGSRFVESGGVFGVRMGGLRVPFTERRVGGTVVPGRLTRRGEPTDVDLSDETVVTQPEMAAETTRAIREAVRRRQQQPDVTPVTTPTTGTRGATGRTTATDGVLTETTPTDTVTETTGVTETTASERSTSGSAVSGTSAPTSTTPTDTTPTETTPTSTQTTPTSSTTPPTTPTGTPTSPTTTVTTPVPPPPPTPVIDIDIPEPETKRRKFDITPFEKRFESGVASPEEVLTEDVSVEDLGVDDA